MKTLKEVLPLYIGCSCQCEDGSIQRLSSVDICEPDASIVMITTTDDSSHENDNWSVWNDNQEMDRVVLILRPLETITDEELAEVWATIGGAPHLGNLEEIKEWIVDGNCPDVLTLGAYDMAHVVHLLITKSFDLFDLIPQKMAVEVK